MTGVGDWWCGNGLNGQSFQILSGWEHRLNDDGMCIVLWTC